MFAVSRDTALLLIIGLCIAGLSLHFAMESLGGMQESHGQMQGTPASHEEDQFILNELWTGNSAQSLISRPSTPRLKTIIRTLAPLLPPPKSI